MRTEIHPAARHITWLVIVVGGITALVGLAYLVFNLGPGISLPFTRTALDAGWLLVFGLMWFVVGLVMLRWLRPTSPATVLTDDRARKIDEIEIRLQNLETRLTALEHTLPKVRMDTGPDPRDLDNELGSLATTIQDAHTRLDDLGDVNHRLHDLESQLDQLYVTLQDAHRRLDEIEKMP